MKKRQRVTIRRKLRKRRFAAAGVVLGVVIMMVAALPAQAAASVRNTPTVTPTSLTVGQTGIPAALTLSNQSTPAQDTLSWNLTSIRVAPSCSANNSTDCTTPDPGVFTTSATGSGRAGSACAGTNNFTFGAPNANGVQTVTPSAAVTLGPTGSADCIIDFTIDVVTVPGQDTNLGAGGVQTLFVGFLTATSTTGGITSDFGSSLEVTVAQAEPTLTTVASGGVAVGGTVTDTATLAGGATPGGTITFNLYGPDDATCTDEVFESTVPVDDNGDYESDAFTTTEAGVFRWVATYSGDVENEGEGPTACNDPAEAVTVTPVGGPVTPTITTQASANILLGGQVTDTATLAGGNNPTGTITFNLYGPDDTNCATVDLSDTATVNGNGSYTSDPLTPTSSGTWRWRALYGGDAANNPVSGACNDANETVLVSLSGGGGGGDDVARVNVDYTVSPTSRLAPGGSFTFRVEVENNGEGDFTITRLRDDRLGDLFDRGNCDDLEDQEVEEDDTISCSFSADFTGSSGDRRTHEVEVRVENDDDNTDTDRDSVTLAITGVTTTTTTTTTTSPTTTTRPATTAAAAATTTAAGATTTAAPAVTTTTGTVTTTAVTTTAAGAAGGAGQATTTVTAAGGTRGVAMARTGDSNSVFLLGLAMFLISLGFLLRRSGALPAEQ